MPVAQRPTGFARRPAAVDKTAANGHADPITLHIAPLAAQYRKSPGISMRLERLPDGARLSKGRNNGDRSWSLSLDDLDNLQYWRGGAHEPHILAMRVVNLDGGDGATIAVHDIPIARESEMNHGNEAIGEANRTLTDEIVALKGSLSAREAELLDAHKHVAEADRLRGILEAEAAAAKAAWAAETQSRLAAAAAAADASLKRIREELTVEQESRLAALESSAQKAIETAHKRWRDAEDGLAKAEEAWKAGEAARLAAAEAQWRENSAKEIADIRRQTGAALAQARAGANAAVSDEEVLRLRDRISDLEVKLRDSGVELTQLRDAAELGRHRSAEETAAKLAGAERAWKAGEAARIVAAEAQWKERSAHAASDAIARAERAEAALARSRTQDEARDREHATLQASLESREAELSKISQAADEARMRLSAEAERAQEWRRKAETVLARAQESWKAGEAGRLAAAEKQWQAELEISLAGAAARLQRAEMALAGERSRAQAERNLSEDTLRRLRDELAVATAALTARERQLAGAGATADAARATADRLPNGAAAEIESARRQWKKEAAAALLKVEKAWKADEAPRMAAAETRWRAENAASMAEARARAEQAEAALADSQTDAESLRHRLLAAQSGLADHEAELSKARALAEQERDRWMRSPAAAAAEREPAWQIDAQERRTQFRRRLLRDASVFACVAGLLLVLFLRVGPTLASALPRNLPLVNGIQPLLQMAGLASVPTSPPPPEKHAVVNARFAKLRQRPSFAAAVVTKLARNDEVVPVERRGAWVFVRIGNGPGQKQGWLSSSVLKAQTEIRFIGERSER